MTEQVDEAWQAFLEMRRAKGRRAPFTAAAEKRIQFELRRLKADGHDPAEVLWQSVINGWSGVFPLKGRQIQTVTVPSKPANACDDYLRQQAEHMKAVEAERLRRKGLAA